MDSNLDQTRALEDDIESVPNKENGVACQILKTDVLESFESSKLERTQSSLNGMSSGHIESDTSDNGKPVGSKRLNEDTEANDNNKKARTVFITSDDEADIMEKDELISSKMGDESNSSQCLTEKLNCTACHKLAIEVQQHPLLKVIICMDCKRLLEQKMNVKVLIAQTNCSVHYILVIHY